MESVSAIAASISTLLAFAALIGTIIFSKEQLELTREHFERESERNQSFHENEIRTIEEHFKKQMAFERESRDSSFAISNIEIEQIDKIALEDRMLQRFQMNQNQKQFDSSFSITKKQAKLAHDAVFGVIEVDQFRDVVLHDLNSNIIPNVTKIKEQYEKNINGEKYDIIVKPVFDILQETNPLLLSKTFRPDSNRDDISRLRSVYHNTSLLVNSQDILDAIRSYEKSGNELANEQLGNQIQKRRWLFNKKIDKENANKYKEIRELADEHTMNSIVSFLNENISACESILENSKYILEKYNVTDSSMINLVKK